MKIEYTPKASKQFSRLDKAVQARIKKYMCEITTLNDPHKAKLVIEGKQIDIRRNI